MGVLVGGASFTFTRRRETMGDVRPWYWYAIRVAGGGLAASFGLHFLVDRWLGSRGDWTLVPFTLFYISLLGFLVGLGGLALSNPRYRLVGVSGAVLVGMYVTGKFGARWIQPGDTGKFVLASLFVVPSVGLLVGFVRLTRSARGWRRGVAVVAAFASTLLVAVIVLFIALGVVLIQSGFDGF